MAMKPKISKREHCREDGPAVAGRAGELAQRDGQRGWNEEHQQHFDEVRQRCRVFKRVGAVGVEEAAAIGAEHLDCFLRGDRALANCLRCRGFLERRGDGVGLKVLRNALLDQDRAKR